MSPLLFVATLLLLFGLVSKRLAKTVITPPMVFVAVGMVVSPSGLGLVELELEGEAIHLLGELTLMLVLFGDAARIDLRALRREVGLPVRLLGIGMPLTIALGTLAAKWLMPELGWWEAAALGAILAPTDAALGQAVVSSTRVPLRIRQALNVESGLNDGIAVPLVLICMAVASSAGETHSTTEWVLFTAKQVTLGPLAGVAVGWIGGTLIGVATQKEWMSASFHQLSSVALALLAYSLADAIGGNGFIAAFVGGITLGNTQRGHCEPLFEFIEAEGQFLMLLIFTVLGAVLVWPAIGHASWRSVAYAGLSLTVVRIAPVFVSLLGSGLRLDSKLFMGWFGPRGLASILFVLLLVEDSGIAHREDILCAVILTVVGSVAAHGLTALPASSWYGARVATQPSAPEHDGVTVHRERSARLGEG